MLFHQDNSPPIFTRNDLTLVFEPPVPAAITSEEASDIWCAAVLCHAANKCRSVQITGGLNERQQHFWLDYLRRLKGTSDVSFVTALGTGQRAGTEGSSGDEGSGGLESGRLGLLFGGGVESLTALSLTLHLKPVLLSLHGPMWMNNDYSVYPLKRKLEDQLAQSYNLQIVRVWHDLRPLVDESDQYVNRWITGAFMYYCFVPQMRELNIHLVLQAMELEYSLVSDQYDRSIHPRFIVNVARTPLPPVLSVLNAVPKVELLDMLYSSNTKLCSYIYSCFRNSERRWCGECGKCRRISAFCNAVGVPPSRIGMREGIPHIPETGELTSLYWRSLDSYLARRGGGTTFDDSRRPVGPSITGVARLARALRRRFHH